MRIKKINITSIHTLNFDFDTVADAKAKGLVFGGEAGYRFFSISIYFRNFTILIEV